MYTSERITWVKGQGEDLHLVPAELAAEHLRPLVLSGLGPDRRLAWSDEQVPVVHSHAIRIPPAKSVVGDTADPRGDIRNDAVRVWH